MFIVFTSLKQHTFIYGILLRHIILIPSQSIFALTLSETRAEATRSNLIVFAFTGQGSYHDLPHNMMYMWCRNVCDRGLNILVWLSIKSIYIYILSTGCYWYYSCQLSRSSVSTEYVNFCRNVEVDFVSIFTYYSNIVWISIDLHMSWRYFLAQ